MSRPNVILLLADDLGIGDLSCYNPNSKLHTENIDKLAAGGIRYNDAHASSALCTPSRYGLLTGRYNWRSRLKRMVLSGYENHLIEDGRTTLGTLFKKAGYQTACVGKWHLGMDWEKLQAPETFGLPPEELDNKKIKPETLVLDYSKPIKNGPNDFGFDYCYVTPGSLDISPYVFIENDRVAQRPSAITGTDSFWPSKHTGTQKGVPYISNWPIGHISDDYNHMNVVPDSADRVLKLIDDYSAGDSPFFIYYPVHAPHVPCIPTPEFEGKSCLGPYGDMVLMIDSIVGRIMDKLTENGIADDTIFVFASDNGGEHEFPDQMHSTNYIYRGFKSDIWDGGHRIPLIVRYPGGVERGRQTDQTVCLTDFMSTFADVLNIRLNDGEGEDSFSHLGIWSCDTKPSRDAIVHHSGLGMFSIRRGKWKLEMCSDGGGFARPGYTLTSGAPPIQLYDMEQDPRETTNVSDDNPETVSQLITELTDCIISGRSTPGCIQKNTGPEWWPELSWIGENI